MRSRLIAVEGNSGVGKTTVAAHLRDRLDAALFHYPPEFTHFRGEVDMDSRVPPMANLLYHLGATLHLSDLVEEQLGSRHVVCDRYWPGPLSLLSARGVLDDTEMERLSGPFELRLLRPDLTVLVRATHSAACARIRGRAERDGTPLRTAEQWVLESEEFFTKREVSLKRHAERLGPLVEVDTTNLSAEAAGLEVESLCRSRLELAG